MLTEKQKEALNALKSEAIYYLLDGGARSGKTHLIIAYILAYAAKYAFVRCLTGRLRFAHAKAGLWRQTVIPLTKKMFPRGGVKINKSDFVVELANGSSIHLAGFDDAERSQKIMGQEYAVIHINESKEIPYSTVEDLLSRLNHKSVPLKFIADTNPGSPSNWNYRLFVNGIDPNTSKEKTILSNGEEVSFLHERVSKRIIFHPTDNKENISVNYLENVLGSLSGVKKKWLLDGSWTDISESAVYYRFNRSRNISDSRITPTGEGKLWRSWDFGTRDLASIIWFEILPMPISEEFPKGVKINITGEYIDSGKSASHYAKYVLEYHKGQYRDAGDPAGSARGADLKSWFSILSEYGIYIESTRKYGVYDMISLANEYIPYIRICERQCPKTVAMLENWSYPTDSNGNIIPSSLPIHDEYSHPGTALYYFFANCFKPKKQSGFSII